MEVTLLGQNVNTYGVELATVWRLGSCCGPAVRSTGCSGCASPAPLESDFTDDVIAAMAETPNVMSQLPYAVAVGLRRGSLQADAALLHRAGEPSGDHLQGPCRDARGRHHHRHHRRLPWRDRGGLPGHARRGLRSRGSRNAFTFQYSHPAGDSRGDHACPGAEGGRPGAVRPPASPSRRRSPGPRTAQQTGRAVGVLIAEGEGRKDGERPSVCRGGPRQPPRPRGPGSTPRPGDMVTAEVTYAAPHHLVADKVVGVRRTRSGDAWEARQGRPPALQRGSVLRHA